MQAGAVEEHSKTRYVNDKITDHYAIILPDRTRRAAKSPRVESQDLPGDSAPVSKHLFIRRRLTKKYVAEIEVKGEHSGIGTSATRAEILKKLFNIKYMALNEKTQVITPTYLGELIYEVVHTSMKQLLNPELTASWEKGLTYVAEGSITPDEYMQKLERFVIGRTYNAVHMGNAYGLRPAFDAVAVFYQNAEKEKKSSRSAKSAGNMKAARATKAGTK